jgi:hypothetical protein
MRRQRVHRTERERAAPANGEFDLAQEFVVGEWPRNRSGQLGLEAGARGRRGPSAARQIVREMFRQKTDHE